MKIFLAQKCCILGEPIIGTVELTVSSPTRLRDLYLFVNGTSYTDYIEQRIETKRETTCDGIETVKTETFEERNPVTNTFFRSNRFRILDEKYFKDEKALIELPPGKHQFTFSVLLPEDLPCSTTFSRGLFLNNLTVEYKLYVVMNTNGKEVTSSPFSFPIVASVIRHYPMDQTFYDNSTNADISIELSDSQASIGQDVLCTLNCKNNFWFTLNLKLFLKTYHTCVNTHVEDNYELFTIDSMKSSEERKNTFTFQIPLETKPTVTTEKFSVENELILTGRAGIRSVYIRIPITVNCDIHDPEVLKKRCEILGYERIPIDQQKFPGFHSQELPMYSIVVDETLPLEVEKIMTRNDVPYYISHFTRQTSATPDMTTPCGYPYPLYYASLLPPGWSVGMEFGKLFFIDHNTKTTTWNDPRPIEQQFVPHMKFNKKSIHCN